jgi:hypothetical protein
MGSGTLVDHRLRDTHGANAVERLREKFQGRESRSSRMTVKPEVIHAASGLVPKNAAGSCNHRRPRLCNRTHHNSALWEIRCSKHWSPVDQSAIRKFDRPKSSVCAKSQCHATTVSSGIEELTPIPRTLGLHELSCHHIRIGAEAMERAYRSIRRLANLLDIAAVLT